jgi:hypothetical protein
MKKYILSALLFILIGSIHAQTRTAGFYKETYRKAFVTLHNDTIQYQKVFFNSFPSNFKDFKKFYGWNERTGLGRPLTNVPANYFTRFFEIKCVPSKALANKIIDVSVNAAWYAGAIALFQQNAYQYAITHNKEFVNELQLRSKADIISVWAFYFDYLNSDFRKSSYDKLVKATAPNDKAMVALITSGYKKAGAKWSKKH